MRILKFVFIAWLFIAQSLFSYEVVVDRSGLPSVQNREMKKLVLDNGLRVLLISDSDLKQSSVALSVNAGSWHEPDRFPGLAHFLEHMIFLGTKEHPEEGSFDRFVKEHGGRTNAFTEDIFTTYIFSIDTDGLPEALERFSEFFRTPLFNPSGASREINAVMQEFQGHFNKDETRRYMIYKELANPDHPFSRFHFGNDETLKDVDSQDLRQWFQAHYSANLMRLIVYSPLPLNELTRMAVEDFSAIPNKRLAVFRTDEPLLTDKTHEKVIVSTPIKESNTLTLFWELPKRFSTAYIADPDQLVCHVLGHEGEESLLRVLQKEGLADGLACGSYRWNHNHAAILIQIELTNQGVKKWKTVVKRVFQTIAYMKAVPYPKYLFDERNRLALIKHRFPAKNEPFNYVYSQSLSLRQEPLDTFPKRSTLIETFDPGQVKDLLEQLKPDAALIELMAPESLTGIEGDRKEKWTQTPYAVLPIDQKTIASWKKTSPHPAIAYPAPNPFIPANLLVKYQGEKKKIVPKELITGENGSLYYAQDTQFNIPKASLTLWINTPAADYRDAKKIVLNDLYLRALNEALTPVKYLAKLGGIEFEISQEYNGIELQVYGYDENLPVILKEISKTMHSLSFTRETYQRHFLAQLSEYRNEQFKSPFQQGADLFKEAIYSSYVPARDKAAALETLTFDDLQKHAKSLYEKTYLKGMLIGNLTEKEAKNAWQILGVHFQSAPYPLDEQLNKEVGVLNREEGPFYLRKNVDVRGNGLLLAIQNQQNTFVEYAAQEILSQLISNPYFVELRTKQQTGYVVGNLQQEVEKQLFLFFVIESHAFSPYDLLQRSEKMFSSFLETLTTLEEQFESIRQAKIEDLEKGKKDLHELGKENFSLVFEYRDPEWNQKRLSALKDLCFERFVELVNGLLCRSNHRRLAILIDGITENNGEYREAPSLRALKNTIEYQTGEEVQLKPGNTNCHK